MSHTDLQLATRHTHTHTHTHLYKHIHTHRHTHMHTHTHRYKHTHTHTPPHTHTHTHTHTEYRIIKTKIGAIRNANSHDYLNDYSILNGENFHKNDEIHLYCPFPYRHLCYSFTMLV